jgi:hypothetical protein
MRWSVGRKLAGLAVCGVVGIAAVGVVGGTGTGSVNSQLNKVVRDNAAKDAQAEVDAAHNTVKADVLQAVNPADAKARSDALSELSDSLSSIQSKLNEVVKADVSPTVNQTAKGVLAARDTFAAASNDYVSSGGKDFDGYSNEFDTFTSKVDDLSGKIDAETKKDIASAHSSAGTTTTDHQAAPAERREPRRPRTQGPDLQARGEEHRRDRTHGGVPERGHGEPSDRARRDRRRLGDAGDGVRGAHGGVDADGCERGRDVHAVGRRVRSRRAGDRVRGERRDRGRGDDRVDP